jgi:putative membrane protein
MLFSGLLSCAVYVLHHANILRFSLPFSLSAILGSALAIFIAFRNNTAYARWWEARSLWGSIVNSSRVLARLIITFTDSHAHQPQYNREKSEAFKRQLVHLCIAWPHVLRMQLRNSFDPSVLAPYLHETDLNALTQAQQKPNFLHLLMGKKIYQAMADGTLGGFDSFQMEGQLVALAHAQGGCERIKNTPLLRQYHFFTQVFLYTFMGLLPFTLVGDFDKPGVAAWLIPLSLLMSFVFAIIAKVGEVNEDPFENRITDVPLTAICNTIERDLLEMLGESTLPEKALPQQGYLY